MSIEIVQAGYDIAPGHIFYIYRVSFGQSNSWTVRKKYGDFVAWKQELTELYRDQVPYLTGTVLGWKKLKKETAEKRLPKLFEFLSTVNSQIHHWKPTTFVVEVPHPDNGRTKVCLSTALFEFLDVANHMGRGAVDEVDEFEVLDMADVPDEVVPEVEAAEESDSGSEAETEETASEEDEHAKIFQDVDEQREQANAQLVIPKVTGHSVTSQVHVACLNFTIIPREYIEYTFDVEVCGARWSVRKRYSEFVSFQNELQAVYGSRVVPELRTSVNPFKRFDESTAMARMTVLETYLRRLLADADEWDPVGLLADFHVRPPARAGTYAMNMYICEFLNVKAGVMECVEKERLLQAEKSGQAAATNNGAADVKADKAMQAKKGRQENVKRRKQILRALEEYELDIIVSNVASFDDDADVVAYIKTLLENFVIADNSLSGTKDGDAERNVPEGDPFGLTTEQLARIAKAVFFNDTRAQVILLLCGILVEDNRNPIVDTLCYDTKEVKRQMLEVFMSRDVLDRAKELRMALEAKDPNSQSDVSSRLTFSTFA